MTTQTTPSPHSISPAAADDDRPESDAPASHPAGAWDPYNAWRLGGLYAPIAQAVEAILASSDVRQGENARPLARVLEVGGTGGALATLLDGRRGAGLSAAPACEVRSVPHGEDAHRVASDLAFDCIVAVDWLPLLAPSQREAQVRELCRAARGGVVFASPFDSPEAAAAERAVNGIYRAARGQDHPRLGRHIELGLPDADAARHWLKSTFEFVEVVPLESVVSWQFAESLAALEPAYASGPTAVDAAAAALFPNSGAAGEGPFYRSLLVASTSAVLLVSEPAPAPPAGRDLLGFATHLALEAAAQRRAFDRLVESITTGRQRERDEFSESVASLAAELRERETAAESLARQVRRHEHTIENLKASLAEAETRAYEAEEREAQTRVHVRNLDAMIVAAEERARAAEEHVALGQVHARNLGAMITAAEERAAASETRVRDADAARAHVQQIHEQFLAGRAGRLITAYVRAKRRLLGREG
jgi:hypothetical protein